MRAVHATPRRWRARAMTVALWSGALLTLTPCLLIVGHILVSGIGQLTPTFLTTAPAPPGVRGGGIANGLLGSLLLVLIATTFAVPVGVGAGLFLAEHRGARTASVVRLLADVLGGLPTIVIGIAVWELVVRPSGHFSAWAGGAALALLIIPLVARATESMVRLVPPALSEAAMALGFSRWRTARVVVLRTALPGIATAVLLATARAAGEAAPLLFTAFGSPYWSADPARPIAAVPLQIYAYALGPYDDWRAQAWTSALVLLLIVAGFAALARGVLAARARLLAAVTPRVGRFDD